MTLFRRIWRAAQPPPSATAPGPTDSRDDDPRTLLSTVYSLNRYINAHSGRLPARSVVTARLITDGVREVIETSAVRPLDVYALVSVKGIINDYLPTTLSKFLALDESHRTVARPSGRTPIVSLQEQLESLLEATLSVLTAAQAQDADALLTQGNFLSTKFSRSDLDL